MTPVEEYSSKKDCNVPTILESQIMSYKNNFPCFLKTNRGSLKLCDENGFRFIRNRIDGKKIYWNCERKKMNCKARAISLSESMTVSFSGVPHNHMPPIWTFQDMVSKRNSNGKSSSFSEDQHGKFPAIFFVYYKYWYFRSGMKMSLWLRIKRFWISLFIHTNCHIFGSK